MLTGFLTLAGGILSILFYLMKRHDTREDDPKQQNLERYAQIDRDIAKGNSLAATLHATADLDELDRLQNAGGSRAN
jgi:hypothetical protein